MGKPQPGILAEAVLALTRIVFTVRRVPHR